MSNSEIGAEDALNGINLIQSCANNDIVEIKSLLDRHDKQSFIDHRHDQVGSCYQ
jgi:hypothetical protein